MVKGNASKHLVLEPELNGMLAAVLERACAALGFVQETPRECRELVASRLLQMAQLGERDPALLESDAVHYFSRRFAGSFSPV